MGLCTVGHSRGICIIREIRTQAYVREFLLQKALQTGGSVLLQCTAKEAKNDIGVIGVVVF